MRDDISGDWIGAIRPGDEHALPEATSYDDDAYNGGLALEEIGAVEADEEASRVSHKLQKLQSIKNCAEEALNYIKTACKHGDCCIDGLECIRLEQSASSSSSKDHGSQLWWKAWLPAKGATYQGLSAHRQTTRRSRHI